MSFLLSYAGEDLAGLATKHEGEMLSGVEGGYIDYEGTFVQGGFAVD